MTSYIFVGPTLRPEEVTSVLPAAVCLPPVMQGDVYRVTLREPQSIGIVDGYFSGAPSVWHKEILWALSRGVPVFGSSSMGALRAAELHSLGMRGIGRIFEAYRDGDLEDDDEVAVVHGPPETGFMAVSEPMVNIRATLERAEAEDVISHGVRSRIETVAKSLFFSHRTWPAVFAAVGRGVSEADLAEFRKWLPSGSVDQKRIDALEMLAVMKASAGTIAPDQARVRFEATHFWDDLVTRMANGSGAADGHRMSDLILDELRLEGSEAYQVAMRGALLRMLATREWERRRMTLSPDTARAAALAFRTAFGLFSNNELRAWASGNDLDEHSLSRLLDSDARLGRLESENRGLLTDFLLDELRRSDTYQRFAARARDKVDQLRDAADGASVAFPDSFQLRVWFFENRLGCEVPEDINGFAGSLGFTDAAEFDGALRREWTYSSSKSGSSRHPYGQADGDLPI